jgi:L-histidine N-alpha-methyltransferase
MKYFKNTELAKLYHVSEKSVRNWIEAAETGKIDLQLFDKNGKNYIANTSKNTLLIEKQVEKGKKFKNTRGLKTIVPDRKFYETYSPKQIFDIIANLKIHHEMPLHYTYVDGGADFWDKYAFRLVDEEAPNLLTSTVDLLEGNFDQLKKLIGNRKVNIIDLGPGNGLPVRNLLNHLLDQNQLNRYVAIDVSKNMLQIAKDHITSWFDKKVKFEGYIRDFSHERFDDIIASERSNDMPLNLVLLLGGTLCNFRSPELSLQAINNSLGIDDLLIYTSKLDTPNSRRYFDFNITAGGQGLAPRHKLPFDLMGIDESFYSVEQLFDEAKLARFITIKPNVDFSIEFRIGEATRKIELLKNEPILVWRYWHQNITDVIEQFDQNGFDLMQVSRSKDLEFLMVTATIKHQ